MEIQLAKQHGFCFGVKRAIQIAEEYKNSFTFGPVVKKSDRKVSTTLSISS